MPDLKARFRAHSGRDLKPVDVPGVGKVFVKKLTAREQFETAEAIPDEADDMETTLAYVVACVCDEDGFSVFDASDIEWLQLIHYQQLHPLLSAVHAASGMVAKVEDAAKNS